MTKIMVYCWGFSTHFNLVADKRKFLMDDLNELVFMLILRLESGYFKQMSEEYFNIIRKLIESQSKHTDFTELKEWFYNLINISVPTRSREVKHLFLIYLTSIISFTQPDYSAALKIQNAINYTQWKLNSIHMLKMYKKYILLNAQLEEEDFYLDEEIKNYDKILIRDTSGTKSEKRSIRLLCDLYFLIDTLNRNNVFELRKLENKRLLIDIPDNIKPKDSIELRPVQPTSKSEPVGRRVLKK